MVTPQQKNTSRIDPHSSPNVIGHAKKRSSCNTRISSARIPVSKCQSGEKRVLLLVRAE